MARVRFTHMFDQTKTLDNPSSEMLNSVRLLAYRFSGYLLLAFCEDPALIAFSLC